MMDLSIVILHHGNPKEVVRNLEALGKAWLPTRTEVFVINNGRQGCNAEIPKAKNTKYDLRFFEIPNKGYPQGNNYGLKMAQGNYVCILNPDVRVEKNTFKTLLDYMKAHKKVGIVGPRLKYPSGIHQDNYRTFPRFIDLVIKRTAFLHRFFQKRMRRYLMWDKDVHVSEPVDWLTGAFQVYTRKAWKSVGPKDERYFLFMSDVDICRTAWRKGFEVHFIGDTQAGHNEGRLSAGGFTKIFRSKVMRIHVMDAFKYYWKYKFSRLPRRSPSGSKGRR
jgi:N-acetylglucosaminyl-diphospho-decaprenol L-rhamnosyltransferase